MKRTKEWFQLRGGLLGRVALAVTLVFLLWLSDGPFTLVSHAESAGRVISSNGANVRSSASATASVLTSYEQNTVISIRGQVQAGDGYTWYEVWVDDQNIGYIRSDLVEITDGSTPPASTQVTPTQTEGGSSLAQAEVSAVNPVSATVVGGGSSGVRIRSNASVNSQIVTTVQNNLALTVTGQANSLDSDGKVWYQVNFNSDGSEVSGFIRSDYVQLSGELTAYEPEVPDTQEPETGGETENTVPTVEAAPKEFDTVFQDGIWYLTTPDGGYDINDLLSKINEYPALYDQSAKNVKTQKIVIVILVFLLVAAVGAIGFLVFKIKDMADSAYFNEVENETLRRRSAQGGRVMPTVGAEKRGAPQGQRPARASQGQRPAGTPQGQRPTGAPQGQRPAGASQGQRPAGASQGQRPAGTAQSQRPAGASQGQRPVGAPQGQRPAGAGQGQKAAAAGQGQHQRPVGQGNPKPQSKNFMADEDDEFEFEFLNYDGEEENERNYPLKTE